MLPYTRLGNEKNWERAIERTKEVLSKTVKCLNDGKCFDSMTDASKYYGLAVSTIGISVHENRKVFRRKDKVMFEFIFI